MLDQVLITLLLVLAAIVAACGAVIFFAVGGWFGIALGIAWSVITLMVLALAFYTWDPR